MAKSFQSFRVKKFGRKKAVALYEQYILGSEELLGALTDLKGKTLGCWCAPKYCHGYVLRRLAEKTTTMMVKVLEGIIKDFKKDVAEQFLAFGGQLDSLQKKINDDLESHAKSVTEDILQIRAVHIDNLVNNNKALQRKNYELETRITEVEDRLAKVERQLNQVEANNRKSNVEIDGIPDFIDDDESLKNSVIRIVNYLTDGQYTLEDIEACHRLPGRSPKPTIVRMNRNILDQLKINSKKLKGVDQALNFPHGTRIYMKDNQSPTMRMLASNARRLKEDGRIDDTWFSNAAVRIKHSGKIHKVTHETDLLKIAPDYEDFSFDTAFGCRVLFENPDFMDVVRMDRLDGVTRRKSEVLDHEAIALSVGPVDV